MRERKGISVMMLGTLIGLLLLVIAIVIILYFYRSEIFGSIMDGLRNALPFQGGSSGGGGVGNPLNDW
jgi:hypothetical protein